MPPPSSVVQLTWKTALGNAKSMLQGPGSRAHARKIAVVMMDKGSSQSQNDLELAAKSLRDIEALVIGIGIGRQIPVNQLEWITLNSYYIMLFPWTGNYRHLCFGLAARCFKGMDPREATKVYYLIKTCPPISLSPKAKELSIS